MCYFSLPLDLPAPDINITTTGDSTAGEMYTLICTVTSVANLFSPPELVWMKTDSGVLNGSETLMEGTTTARNFTFSPLLTSQGGEYTCQATITITKAGIEDLTNTVTMNVSVQSK